MRVLALLFSLLAVVGWDNLDYGVPGTNGVVVLEREGYACGFDTNALQPRWVSYRLTKAEIDKRFRIGRTNDFREDPLLPHGTVTLDDYRGSGYDRGHLAPAADMGWASNIVSESFFLSNMSPQRPEFNRGIWKDLEHWVREGVERRGSVFVYSGPVWKMSWSDELELESGRTNSLKRIGRHGVVVPEGYFKVLLSEGTNDCLRAIGFLLPNRGSTNSLASFAVPVSAVEAATGLDFFSNLPAPMQSNLESRAEFREW